jgi:phosphoglycerate dehydrogenase-like enzyme
MTNIQREAQRDAPTRVALLDDYQHQALRLVDWSAVQSRGAVLTAFDRHLDQEEAARELADFDVVCHLRERMPMPASLIASLPRLKMVVVTGVQHMGLDMQACAERGIRVVNVPGNPEALRATPELAWGLILALARDIPQASMDMRRGGWQHHCGRVLQGKTLGILGLGRMGKAMVPVAHAFGMQVVAWSQNMKEEDAASVGAQRCPLEELMATSDFVSLHLVLSERTRGIVGARELAAMKPSAYLVNTARAGLVDMDALCAALDGQQLAGAALDVFAQEPLPDDSPLRRQPRLMLTPHLGYTTIEALTWFYRGTAERVLEFLEA